MKIGVLTITNDHYMPVVHVTHAVNFAYCSSHGYEFHPVHIKPASWAETVWSKIPEIAAFLPQYDWLMWIDADAIVMTHSVMLETLIEACHEGSDLIISKDYPESGRIGDLGINCGVFLIRNCEWSHQYLKHVDEHKPNYIGLRFPEQMAMEACIPYGFNLQHIAYLPNWLLNQFWRTWQPGDFVAHHAGGSVEDKVKGLTPFLEKVIYK